MMERRVVAEAVLRLVGGFCRYAHRWPRLLGLLRLMRAAVVLGPLRSLAIDCLRRVPSPIPLVPCKVTMFSDLDVPQCVTCLQQAGYVLGLQLPEGVAMSILAFASTCRAHDLRREVHERCEVVWRVARDPKLIAILRQCLGGEPILHASFIRVPARGPEEAAGAPEYRFHYDIADIASFSVFFYLTDVDLESGPHVVVEGSQGRKGIRDLIRPVLDDRSAEARFGRRIKPILGHRGTGFIEDLTCFHKRLPEWRPRWLLGLEYTLVRRPLT